MNTNGLLYVPSLPAGDPCVKLAAPFVPNSAVRRANFPPTNYNLIALAPWISAACSKRYMSSAQTDPLRGFIFYQPGNSSDEPPPSNSPIWELNGSARWKTQSAFPVYAVSSLVGYEIMRQLSFYSGNLTEVPHGQNITELYDPNPEDYVRIWTDITVSIPTGMVAIWVYFLIIGAVLLGVVFATSLFMHLTQARRRASLRRRIAAGDVNLEGMGIKRLTVTLEHVQQFPLFTYNHQPTTASLPKPSGSGTCSQPPHRVRTQQRNQDLGAGSGMSAVASQTAIVSCVEPSDPFGASAITTAYQPACAICLESYKSHLTIIREISCGHIFHPECIDEFLSENSSLCPLCKTSMLPQGYCPKITDSIVRREHAIRRLRDRVVVEDEYLEERKRGIRIRSMGNSTKMLLFPSANLSLGSWRSTELPPPRMIGVAPLSEQCGQQKSRSPAALVRAHMRALAGAASVDDDTEVRLTRCMYTNDWN